MPPPRPVPAAYQGVWARTLLETPAGRDTSTWVRWVQTAHWHDTLGRSGVQAARCAQGPAAAHSVFQTPDRVVQTGVHDRHLAVWERLPASQGQRIALARRDAEGLPTEERLLLCGSYLLHRAPGVPNATHTFAHIDAVRGVCVIECASDAALDGTEHPWHMQRLGLDIARISGSGLLDGAWEVLEWSDA